MLQSQNNSTYALSMSTEQMTAISLEKMGTTNVNGSDVPIDGLVEIQEIGTCGSVLPHNRKISGTV